MRVSSRKLAASVASRLNSVVPVEFRLSAEEGQVVLYIDDAWDMTSYTLEIVEDESRDFVERLETAIRGVLSSVQDSVSEHLRSPWPSVDGREMAVPGVRSDAELLHLWYGRDEQAPVLSLPDIQLTEIVSADGATPTAT